MVELGCADLECSLDPHRLVVRVPPAAQQTAVQPILELARKLRRDRITLFIHKSHGSFADWMRRCLYVGFSVVRGDKVWDDVDDDVIACEYDMEGTTSTETETDVCTEDEDSDEEE